MSSSNSPCAACKCLRRKCTPECVFAPYFPPETPQKFANVHKVFGASNVSKLLNELNAGQREDAVNSLAYEAEYRLRDPVYGCVGLISILQRRLKQVQYDLENAKKELATYIGPSGLQSVLTNPGLMQQQHPIFGPSGLHMVAPYNVQQQQPMMGIPHGAPLVIREPQHQQQQQQHHQHQQQFLESQQLAAASGREQEMMRGFEQHQYQQQHNVLMRFSGGFDDSGAGPSVTATGFNQMAGGAAMQQQPSYEAIPYHQIQVPQEDQPHTQSHMINLEPQDLLLQQLQKLQQQHQQPPQERSEEARNVGPSC